ncbi:o-succinylbenzoate--CoA ligase [Alicyclobacillus sendaiensis]|uniref:o-succinylbenzoate--CoA ligase n=1 Tax=Alicyclobacillus sendaiensis TaxID=192387 RepID=UPI0026F43FE8|nr:o-succinylbenzoate--CoA ligase [Alicyclobacillus sendaiensis]
MRDYSNNLVLPDWLGSHKDSKHTAIECEDIEWSYSTLFEKATSLAGFLKTRYGLNPGDRVSLISKDGIVSTLMIHALIQLEVVLVPINTRLSPSEMIWQIRNTGTKLLVYDSDQEEKVREIQALMTDSDRFNSWLFCSEYEGFSRIQRKNIELNAVQSIIHTSGTTGVPKGAQITFGNHWWSATGVAFRLGIHKEDRWLVPVPLFHVAGQNVIIRSVIYGTTAIIQSSFDPERVNRMIDEKHITIVSVVPTMLKRMLDHRGNKPYPKELRCVLLGGGPASKALLEQAEALRLPVCLSYGLTESNSQIATLEPQDRLRKFGSVGNPMATTEIRIVSNNEDVPPGTVGEIVLRGPSIISGYFNNDEANKKSFRDGWFYTGDLGYLDEDGYLYVKDRRSDLIISGGENIYPAEVEAVIMEYEGVAEVGVVGMPDDEYGQVPVAVIVMNPGFSLHKDDFLEFCRKRLAKYKIPQKIYLAESLPHNASGKLVRRQLPKMIEKLETVACTLYLSDEKR